MNVALLETELVSLEEEIKCVVFREEQKTGFQSA